ncbi:hypothetical protein [uncultured Thiodictyon sp.]|jgi:hypothetical protein|uniref:hypothetical protein n=1 Tax=uncultured Thiodictyon sp. TaxID=1846217 RepID=UPI0025D26C87|nr:hypothetical protein [uncultured Thiodictyon sp.]
MDVMDVMRFTEIEHKFLVSEQFDVAAFRGLVQALDPPPLRRFTLRVLDRYFLTEHGRANRYVIRHRYDAVLQHLTVKALAADPEVRTEINLDLGQHAGDQSAAVDAFVQQLGATWRGDITKDIEVWEFPQCEIVRYQARSGNRSVHCVEFEAVHTASLEEALAVLERFERATGFADATRTLESLVDLLFPDFQ